MLLPHASLSQSVHVMSYGYVVSQKSVAHWNACKGDFTAQDKVIKVVAGMQAAASGEGSRPWARMAVFSAQS